MAVCGGTRSRSRVRRPIASPSSSGRPGPIALPERHLSGLARRRRHDDAVVRDLLDPPGGSAEDERFAGAALEHHLFVELADASGAFRRAEQEHAEQPSIGNRSAVRHRDALRPFTGDDRSADPVPGHAGSQLGELVGRVAARQHVQHAFEGAPRQFGEGRRAPDRVEEIVDAPLVHGGHRDDLLREDVQRIPGITRRLDRAVVHRLGDRGARDQIAAELGKDHACAHRVDLVPAAADALQSAGHRGRRFDLDDEIDRAHVDAELERRRGDQRAQAAALEQVFDFDALGVRERAVVRAHERLAGQFVQRAGQPLCEPAAVDEDQRGLMRANQLEQPRVDRRPDRRSVVADRRGPARDVVRRREPRHVLDRHFDSQLQTLPRAGVDDRHRTVAQRSRGAELGVDDVRIARRLPGRLKRVDRLPTVPFPPETSRPPREDAVSPRGRCAAEAARSAPRAVRSTAQGARRAWSARAHGSRR